MGRYILASFLFLIPFLGSAQSLYSSPTSSFFTNPSETITDLSFHSAPVDTIQANIETTRSAYPKSIIRVTLSGVFLIDSLPITLSSKMLLILNYATILANNKTTAAALIAVPSDTMVSIVAFGTGLLDGGNNNVTGINVTNSGKTHIDGLTIANCKKGGIYYNGRGPSFYADAGSVTRCTFNNCGSTGISYNNSFNFICTDNNIQNTTLGIHINGNNSAVSNNIIRKCTTGVESVSSYEAITYNTIDSCTTAVSLTTLSTATLVANNIINGNSIGLSLKGSKASVYHNYCNNTKQVYGSGSYNELFDNWGISSTQGNVKGCIYFNPPTTANPHKNLIKVGKERYDITINDTLLTAVRGILDSIHNLYANSVIVVHLNGSFTAPTQNDSLVIYDDECILLNGTITGKDSCNRLISFADGCTASFSGGTINGNNIDGKTSLIYVTGSSNVIIDSVNVINSYGQGIEKRSSTTPMYVRACTVKNVRIRCIWAITSPRLYAFQNNTSNGVKDGIDLDAGSSFCVIQKNICTSNQRNGVFIEEGAKNHIVLNNTLNGGYCGLEFYNLMVTNQNSSNCLVAYNNCQSNTRGILVSAISNKQASINNVIFNNTCNNNSINGIGGLYSGLAYGNYVAMNTCLNNTSGAYYSKADYANNYLWNVLANPKLLHIKFDVLKAESEGSSISIKWKLSSIKNVISCKIERSSDGINFRSLEEINLISRDTFLDANPIHGNNYYRIKVIDINGTFIYSSTLLVNLTTERGLSIKYFQPASRTLIVSVLAKQSFQWLQIEIFDLNGKRITVTECKKVHSTQYNQTILLPSISKGIYILSVKTDKGTINKQIQLIK